MLRIAHRAPRDPGRCAELARSGANVFEVDVRLADRSEGLGLVASHYAAVPGWGHRLEHDNWRLRWTGLGAGDQTLADRIGAVPDSARVLLDLKERAPQRRARLLQALAASLTDPSRFTVSTPDAEDLVPLRAAGLRTWRTVPDRRTLAAVLRAGPGEDEGLTVRHTLLDAGTVARLHRLAPVVVAWTVNRPARARALRDAGVDGITTDRPAVLRALTG